MTVSFCAKKENVMAKIDESTTHSCIKVEETPKKIWNYSPIGKESVKKCIKDIGQYIVDNAEKFAENIDRTVSIDINCSIGVNELPEVQVIYTNRPINTWAESESSAKK